jgi:hypothetical protein
MLAGVPAKVLKAANAAKAAADAAWRVLGDPAARPLYDSQIGVRGNGQGLDRPEPGPPGPGGEIYGRGISADMVMAALADLMTPHPAPARRIIVPDLRGLFAGSCLRVAGNLGLHLETVHLTTRPMAVEGLVVDQSPPPGTKVRREGTVTVQIWHPALP